MLIDLIRVGVARADAEAISLGAGLKGKAARKFIGDADLARFEITPAAQKKLFEITYEAEAAEARRLATRETYRRSTG